MAYQQQGGLGNGGGGPEHHGPQGTEYTLQGVMRFLQIEWHNHERARNAWDIERAEMKAKIAKQEGESRQAKRINEQLERQVRMLENALKNERAKKQTPNGTPAASEGNAAQQEAQKVKKEDSKNGEKQEKPGYVPHNSFLETGEQNDSSEKAREEYLDQTTKYLKNCMKEIQYLLTPPQHPPPPQVLPNGNITGLPDAPHPHSMQDIYDLQYGEQARQGYRNGRGQGQILPQQQQLPNHQPPPVPNSLPPAGAQRPDNRGLGYSEYTNHAQQPVEHLQAQQPPSQYEEQVENITHTFDREGREVRGGDAQQQQQRPARQQAETDGWTFDEEPPPPNDLPPPDGPPPRRPDTDMFPSAASHSQLAAKSPPRAGLHSRRKSSGSQSMNRRRSSQGKNQTDEAAQALENSDPTQFKVKFALRGHLDVVRSVIFSGGGSPSEPEVCTAGDDGTIKRWIVPATYQNYNPGNTNADLDIQAIFTHRGHEGVVTSLTAPPASTGFSTGGRANGEGWVFSGGQDATVRVWERGRVDPKATLEGHTDAVWAVCVLPASVGVVFGPQSGNFGGPDRLLLVSGSADGTVKVWAVSAPPQSASPATGSRRGVGGSRRHSVTSGSNYPTSPQPSVASTTPFSYTLVHSIERPADSKASPTSICPLSPSGETFVVSYTDSSVLIFDTRTGEEVIGMASTETYDGTPNTSINAVAATSSGLEQHSGGALDAATRGLDSEEVGGGATGGREGLEGVVITGHEDRFVRFFDANSGQCTYTMLAHPSAISALSLSKDGREAVSAGHDASIRFWSLEKRICTQDITSHRAMRGEGVCDVCWSQDGRLVVSAGGDGVVKVFAR
ncbi:Putative striatin, WD40/YVTN repeat-like-containing domain superfamily [Septoria linicola]|uniref:Striatin, WD40/YVTN repeat-like-containing domain superfamily n=1 Tax=Septoria linicola TaxID=215465 RepID=A0A9Q9AR68_9PEZI|nr:putative striatin, WD40/YVTN repeat-like-containing domain superfamily [Septoria linicola]USW51653.1 Putative striatin, WD40/YVTN repeat-like-containing domain superfamily [Septoria linicola]